MLEVCLFCCSCIVCSLLLVCAVLKTLHSVKHILNEEECRSVGEASGWQDEFAVVIASKTPGAVQETLGVLEKYKGDWLYDLAATGIKSKHASVGLCRHTYPHFQSYPPFTDCALYVVFTPN